MREKCVRQWPMRETMAYAEASGRSKQNAWASRRMREIWQPRIYQLSVLISDISTESCNSESRCLQDFLLKNLSLHCLICPEISCNCNKRKSTVVISWLLIYVWWIWSNHCLKISLESLWFSVTFSDGFLDKEVSVGIECSYLPL